MARPVKAKPKASKAKPKAVKAIQKVKRNVISNSKPSTAKIIQPTFLRKTRDVNPYISKPDIELAVKNKGSKTFNELLEEFEAQKKLSNLLNADRKITRTIPFYEKPNRRTIDSLRKEFFAFLKIMKPEEAMAVLKNTNIDDLESLEGIVDDMNLKLNPTHLKQYSTVVNTPSVIKTEMVPDRSKIGSPGTVVKKQFEKTTRFDYFELHLKKLRWTDRKFYTWVGKHYTVYGDARDEFPTFFDASLDEFSIDDVLKSYQKTLLPPPATSALPTTSATSATSATATTSAPPATSAPSAPPATSATSALPTTSAPPASATSALPTTSAPPASSSPSPAPSATSARKGRGRPPNTASTTASTTVLPPAPTVLPPASTIAFVPSYTAPVAPAPVLTFSSGTPVRGTPKRVSAFSTPTAPTTPAPAPAPPSPTPPSATPATPATPARPVVNLTLKEEELSQPIPTATPSKSSTTSKEIKKAIGRYFNDIPSNGFIKKNILSHNLVEFLSENKWTVKEAIGRKGYNFFDEDGDNVFIKDVIDEYFSWQEIKDGLSASPLITTGATASGFKHRLARAHGIKYGLELIHKMHGKQVHNKVKKEIIKRIKAGSLIL